MTESELLAHAADSYPNSFTCFAMFVTMLTGYLITAYVAGGDLIRSQVVIINSLYLVLAGGTIYGGFMFLLVAEDSDSDSVAWAMTTQRSQLPGVM